MTAARVLFCMGATKAGTSWLYRALHDHPDCALRAVKELHYWDTADAGARDKQVVALTVRRDGFLRDRAAAEAAGRGWQVANMDRRIADLGGLIAVLRGDRTDDTAYRAYLFGAADGRLVADMTPGYAVLPGAVVGRMAAFDPGAAFVYLLRDPLSRLWSHIRMQAQRQRQPHEDFVEKANNILWRILHKGQEGHILERGDYPGTVARLRAAVPAGRLRVQLAETMYTAPGFAALCRWLGLAEHAAPGAERVHAGPEAPMRDDLRIKALRFLKDHYDWAARELGPLPDNWRQNYAGACA